MKVLITGSNGLLGQHLVKLLKRDPQWEVMATARGRNRLQDTEGYAYVSMDICEEEQVRKTIRDFRPDFIIHGAAMTHVDACEAGKEQCWRTNVLATRYLAK